MANVQPSVHSDSAQPGRPATSHRLVVAHTRWRAPASGQIARSYRQVVHTRRTLTHWRASPLTHARHATSPISARSAHDSPSDSHVTMSANRGNRCARLTPLAHGLREPSPRTLSSPLLSTKPLAIAAAPRLAPGPLHASRRHASRHTSRLELAPRAHASPRLSPQLVSQTPPSHPPPSGRPTPPAPRASCSPRRSAGGAGPWRVARATAARAVCRPAPG